MADIKDELMPLFNMPSFYDMFIILNQKYSELNFKDEISDSERISEYKWITQQYRKYISKQRDIILSKENKSDMLSEIESMLSKANEYGNTRSEIVYNIMRDDFLINLYRIIELTVPNESEENDEEGWEE